MARTKWMPRAISKEPLSAMLSHSGVSCDGTVFLHSAFSGLAKRGYRAKQVLEDLCSYFEPGNLMLPTMSWRDVNPENPIFDEIETPSITGHLSEVFRTNFATKRSLHPTHSVACVGKDTSELLSEHHLDDTPCSSRSPFGKLVDADGIVIMLGTEMNRCTLIHHVEEVLAHDIYLNPASAAEIYTCRDRRGTEITVRLRRHMRLKRNFWKFGEILIGEGKLQASLFHNVPVQIFRSRDLVAVVSGVLNDDRRGSVAKSGERWSW